MRPEITIRHLIKRRQIQESQARELAQSIRKQLPDWVEFLVGQGAKRVLLFGSLARDEFRLDSDVDLAVEGMPGDIYFHALGELLLRSPVSCDLVTLEQAPPLLRKRIETEGVVLYDSHPD